MILFFQITNENTKPYSDLCCQINKLYCEKHGYDFLELPSKPIIDFHYTWSKIFQSIDLIESTNYDYYFCLDADAAIINKDIKLESIIDNMKSNIAFSENGLNGGLLIATGGFLFNKDALPIFRKCIELTQSSMAEYKKHHWFEMAVINSIYASKIYDMDVFEMNIMNSYGYIDINNQDLSKLFLYHFQGRSDTEKTKIANDVYQKFFKELI
jgi:hypothetical protein